MIPWHSTDHLILDCDGILWLWTDPGLVRLGPIASADVLPADHNAWAELLDLWSDRV